MKKYNYILLFIVGVYTLSAQSSPNYSVFGVFNTEQNKYFNATLTGLNTNNSTSCYFTSSPTNKIFMAGRISAGSVSFNSQSLSYNTSNTLYSNTDIGSISSKQWLVAGNSTIPYMSFNYGGNMPSFEITNSLLNDTLVKGDTLFFNLADIQNADSISVFIYNDSLGNVAHPTIFRAPNYTNNYYVIPQVFTQLAANLPAVIKIEATNYTYQTISDKQYLFRNTYSFVWPNVVVSD